MVQEISTSEQWLDASVIQHGDESLLAEADAARRRHCGDAVHLRGIIEFSNVCSRNCVYCGLRRDNRLLPRYTMSAGEIVRAVAGAEQDGVRTVVLQSGEWDGCRPDWLAEVVAAVKRRFDVAVTLSVGVKTPQCYRAWRQAGADRYLIKHETANGALYQKLHPDSRLRQRLAALAHLRALGYQVGTGNIVGLPGQRWRDLASDVLLTRRLDVDMAAFGPLVPHPGTPLAGARPGDIGMALRVVAVARLVLGPVHIPATTAFDAVAPDGRERALRAGANVIMANITPSHYRGLYEVYPGRPAENTVDRVKAMLARLGRPLAADQGHSLKEPPASNSLVAADAVRLDGPAPATPSENRHA
jgi:biotin synthase